MSNWPGRLIRDKSLRVSRDRKALIGGSPLTVLRFSDPIDPDGSLSTVTTARLVDLGMMHPRPATGPYGPADVTVVIPAFTRASPLTATLTALDRCGDGVAAIIVVDDGSPDPEPIAGVAEMWRERLPVQLVRRAENGGPAAARNTGLVAVDTPLVALLDAGCEPAAGWLDHLLAQFVDPTLGIVAPRITGSVEHRTVDESPQPSRWSRWLVRSIAAYETTRSPLDLGDQPARVYPRTRVSYLPTACVVIRTETLRAVGTFDETMRVGEDVDLVWRLGEAQPAWRVRYEPTAQVAHDHRTDPVAWWSRRVDYGTSAAPLALRHRGALAPVSVSPWSAAAWILVAAGRPLEGIAVAGTSTLLLARQLGDVADPGREAVRLAGFGNLAAGRLLADAIRRPWWPLALACAMVSKHARRVLVAAFVVPPLIEWTRERPHLDPFSWLVLRGTDDIAYGLGVWIGCARELTAAPLVPDLGVGRFRKGNHR